MLIEIITFINWSILWFFILLSFAYVVLLVASIPDIVLRHKEIEISGVVSSAKSFSMPPVTAIIPTYNEEDNILNTLASILNSTYLNTHVIVVNARSTDQTLQILIDTYKLSKVEPIIAPTLKIIGKIKGYYISEINKNITVIDKEHTDRSDAINAGINACRTPLFFTIDADTLIENTAISRIVFYMLSRPYTIASGGSVYILNGCKFENGVITEAKLSYRPIYGFQICEYLRSFLFSRSGWNAFGGALCYAGAFSIFQHKKVLEVCGFDLKNPAQDFEIITHLHAYNIEHGNRYAIGFTPGAAVWTDVPGTFKAYWKQRYNWQMGMLLSLAPYLRMLFNPKYGIVGLFTYPFFLFGETLGAVVEFTAYCMVILCWALGIINWYWAGLFFLVNWGFMIFLTMATALINFMTFNKYQRIRDLLWILFLCMIEPFGFRQFNVVCRVVATFSFFIKKIKPE